MKNKLTDYFYQVIQNTKHPVIPFKDKDFVTFSFDEITHANFIVSPQDEITCLLSEDEYAILFEEISLEIKRAKKFPLTYEIPCVISYKTLATKFNFGARKNTKVSELTGVFYISTALYLSREENGVVSASFNFNNDTLPWFSRAFIAPSCNMNLQAVTSEEKIDEYIKETTEKRAKIDNWEKYVAYCDHFFNSISDLSLDYEPSCYLFRHNYMDTTMHIEDLYKDLMTIQKPHLLFDRFTQEKVASDLMLILNDNIDAMCSHNGQMNGKYPLADSQRQAVNHFKATKDGNILAVSGPPGTGKTTLLQSLVADLVVDSALHSTNPPIIVASSSNNQAVTNIIDSFRNIEKVNISNLEERWIDGVNSFATYMPSASKTEISQKNGYQFTSISNSEFILEAEKNIASSTQKIQEYAKKYFNKEFSSVTDVKDYLQKQLKLIDSLKCSLLRTCGEIHQFTEGKELSSYIDEIEKLIESEKSATDNYKSRMAQWKEYYKKINFMLRLLSFIPAIKKKISYSLMMFICPTEIEIVNTHTSFSEIEAFYAQKVFETNNEINRLSRLKMQANTFLKNFKGDIAKLREHNCYILALSEVESDKVPNIYKINSYIDSTVRYIEFWLAVHVNECRFLLKEYVLTEKQRGTNFENVLRNFYNQIALLSPCFVMTLYMLPKNFKTFVAGNNSYMYDFIDLLIIDEAGQCSPEIAAASFSLAKRAVVVGDENQIPPVVNIDATVDYSIAYATNVISAQDDFYDMLNCGLSCSQGNVMRVAKNACGYQSNKYDRGLFLCEHRRCYDEIISYSNELIYNGMLVPMRNESEIVSNRKRVLDEEKYPYMANLDIPTGKSSKSGTSRFNEDEAKAIAAWLKEHYNELVSLYTATGRSSKENILAIISPFKAQVSILNKHLKWSLGNDASYISVGTVHTFQGAERNIIIFSTVYSKEEECLFIDNNKNLMNVAVSRAKDAFWVFGSIDCIKRKPESTASGLLYKYISNGAISS